MYCLPLLNEAFIHRLLLKLDQCFCNFPAHFRLKKIETSERKKRKLERKREGLSSAEKKKRKKQKKKEKQEQERKVLQKKLIKAKQLSAQQILVAKSLNKTIREIDRLYAKL